MIYLLNVLLNIFFREPVSVFVFLLFNLTFIVKVTCVGLLFILLLLSNAALLYLLLFLYEI